jgi:thiol-disulfide isomerase/thioredoxin
MQKMNRVQGIILVILLALLIFLGAMILYQRFSADYEELPQNEQISEQMAPAFTVYDEDGQEVKLEDFSGQPVVINCWASWCMPCMVEMPYFQAAYEAYGDDVAFLMVDMNAYGNDTKEAAQKAIEEGGYTFPVYYDDDASLALAYSISATPSSIFVDKEGQLVAYHTGTLSEEKLETYLLALLEE